MKRSKKPIRRVISNNRDWANYIPPSEVAEARQEEAEAHNESRNADLRVVEDAIGKTGMLSSDKRSHVWILVEGWVKKAEVGSVLRSAIVQWAPLSEITTFAQGVREGRLFAVDRATLEQWNA